MKKKINKMENGSDDERHSQGRCDPQPDNERLVSIHYSSSFFFYSLHSLSRSVACTMFIAHSHRTATKTSKYTLFGHVTLRISICLWTVSVCSTFARHISSHSVFLLFYKYSNSFLSCLCITKWMWIVFFFLFSFGCSSNLRVFKFACIWF